MTGKHMACRTRANACDTLARRSVRCVLCWSAFPNASSLPSTNSAARLRALFAGFVGTMEESDFSRPCIIGYGLFGLPDADHG